MAISPTYPGVYIQELPSPVQTIVGVATSIGAFVGFTGRGIDNRAEQIFSWGDFERLFGGLAADSEVSYAVQQFFANGGTQAYVVRVPRHGATDAQVVIEGTNFTLTFSTLSSGQWANNELLVDVDYNGVNQTADATAFNLTVTNLVDGTVETFPSVSLNNSFQNYVVAVVNDPDNGSQLVSVAEATTGALSSAPTITGVVGSALTTYGVNSALGGTTSAGTVSVTQNSTAVVGAGTTFTTTLSIGQWVETAADTAHQYQVSQITDDTHLHARDAVTSGPPRRDALTAANAMANADYGVLLSVTSPHRAARTAPAQRPSVLQHERAAADRLERPRGAAPAGDQLGARRADAGRVRRRLGGGHGRQPGHPRERAAAADPRRGRVVRGADGGERSPTPPRRSGCRARRPPTNVAHYALGTGNGTATAGADPRPARPRGPTVRGLPQTADLIGDQCSSPASTRSRRSISSTSCASPRPRAPRRATPSALDITVDPNAIYSAAIALCDSRRAFLLLDAPPNVNTVSGAVDWKTSALTVNDANGAAFFPRLRLPDPLNNYQLRTFAPCGVVAGVYARIDGTRGVWKAPAGTEATLSGVQSLVYKMTDAENGVLNPLGAQLLPRRSRCTARCCGARARWSARTPRRASGSTCRSGASRSTSRRACTAAPSGSCSSRTTSRCGRRSG